MDVIAPYLWKILPALLLLGCMASFGWAMRNFFVQPSGTTTGMRTTKLCSVAFGVLHLFMILKSTPSVSRLLFCTILYCLALALFWWSIQVNRKNPLSAVFSPNLPVHLMQAGPYRFIRHPFYASYLFCWIAGVIGSGEAWLTLTVLTMLLIYWRAARLEEEKFQRSAFRSAYQDYRSRTGLFLPDVSIIWK